jgi:hypothetical protein
MVTSRSSNYALRGAIGFGAPALLLFGASINPLLSATLTGIVGGIAYRPWTRWVLPVLLGISFVSLEGMFLLQGTPSSRLTDVAWNGLATAFSFWVIGACATLTLPAAKRFDGAAAWAVFGGIAGVAFQFVQGLGGGWEHLALWLIGGAGGGWNFGRRLDRAKELPDGVVSPGAGSKWGIASLACGLGGLGIGLIFFLRYELPLGLSSGFSPAAHAADWLWSWGLLAMVIGVIGIFARGRKRVAALAGIVFAFALGVLSYRIDANPWKVHFNTQYGRNLIAEHSRPDDPRHAYAVYTGNLILAQAALDGADNESAGRFLLQAAAISGLDEIADKGPDMSVASSLLQTGNPETVIEYLHMCAKLWPDGEAVLARWETAIRDGRRVNFNNRAIQQGQR